MRQSTFKPSYITSSANLFAGLFSGSLILEIIPNALDLSRYPYRLREKALPRLVWLRAFHEIYNPMLAPAVIVAERFGLLPEIIIADSGTSAALFTNDEIRMKARHWVSVFVADHRPLYKANVA